GLHRPACRVERDRRGVVRNLGVGLAAARLAAVRTHRTRLAQRRRVRPGSLGGYDAGVPGRERGAGHRGGTARHDRSASLASREAVAGPLVGLGAMGTFLLIHGAGDVGSRVPGASLVYLPAMVPAPGERAADWWSNTGYADAV